MTILNMEMLLVGTWDDANEFSPIKQQLLQTDFDQQQLKMTIYNHGHSVHPHSTTRGLLCSNDAIT